MTSVLSPRESSGYSKSIQSMTNTSNGDADESNPPSSAYTSSTGTSQTPSTQIKIDPRRITPQHELSSRHSSASHPSRPSSRNTSTRQTKSVMRLEDVANSHPSLSQNLLNNLSPSLLNEFERKKRNMEKKVELRLFSLHREKQRKIKEEKEAAESLERRLPMDVLACEWFDLNPTTADMRVYLIEKLMPTLILGMEKILLEADKRGLLKEDEDSNKPSDRFGSLGGMSRPKFNPVNELAQYLMRNNPRFSNFPESSQYARGLHAVAEKLKHEVFDMESNRLAKLKFAAENNREKMEESARKVIEEKAKRNSLLKMQFKTWLLDESDNLQLQLIQNAIFSFLEIASHVSPNEEIKLNKEVGPTDETGETLSDDQFVKYVEELIEGSPSKIFEDLLRHLNQCALAFRKTFELEMWNTMFIKLFQTLDTESTGYLDRHRTIHLLEKFWDKYESKEGMRNPRTWPVIEIEELDDLYPESDDESVMVSTEMDSGTIATMHPDEEKVSFELGSKDTSSQETESKEEKSEKMEQEGDEKIDEEEKDVTEEKKETSDEDDKEVSDSKDEEAEDKKEETDVVQEQEPDKEVDEKEDIKNEAEEEVAVQETVEDEEKQSDDVVDAPEEKEDDKVKTPEDVGMGSEEVAEMDKNEEEPSQGEVPDKLEEEGKEEVEKSENEEVKDEEEPKETSEENKTEEEETDDKKTEEEAKIEEADEMKQRLLEGGDQALTLTTPATVDDGAVKIQFSKEAAGRDQLKVRKTTSLTVVHKKKPSTIASDDDKPKGGYQTVTAAGDAPIQPTTNTKQEASEETESEALASFIDNSEFLIQHTEADMNDDGQSSLFPVEVKTRPASASRMSVTFAAEPVILPGKPSQEFFSEYSSRSQSRLTSAFDENQLNKSRFVSLLESFLDEEAEGPVVESLVNFIHEGYVETEEEKMARLAKARQEALIQKHQEMINNLFNKWDNDGQGYIDVDQVEEILSKYKGGMEASALKQGRVAIRQSRKHHVFDKRINRKEFSLFINTVCEAMVGGEEVFDGVVEFATSTVERTYAERVRGEARRKWLGQVKSAAECSGASMEPVYRSIFQTIYKDAEAHGGQKKASAYIALLENNVVYPERGNLLIRYVACTPDNAPHMLGKAFYEDMRGVSFYCVRRGKLVHVPRVRSHGRVYFWNPIRLEEEKEGSLILLPLKDEQRRVFGLMGIDNLDDPADRSVFSTHELNFYQGIVRTFSSAFHHVDLRRKLLRIIDSAMSWIHSRAPKVAGIVVYFVEPDPKSQAGHVLRKMMAADNNTGMTVTYKRPSRLYRKDNLFRDYLFKCMESSETVTADAYGERHTAYPLRDDEGRCQCVIDMSIGKLRDLPRHERREIQRMLKLLQEANREVMRESIGGEKKVVLEVEANASDETRVEVMFDRLMLTDLRDNVNILDNNVFAELHNYKDPPQIIHNILKSVLMLFHQNPEEYQQFDDWVKCKQLSTTKLKQQIVEFDPTASGAVTEEVHEQLSSLLKGIAHGAVAKHGSRPAQQLYNWAFVCLSLIEHTQKMAESYGQPAITPITSASTATTDTTHAESEIY